MRSLVTTTLVAVTLFFVQGCDVIDRTEPSTSISQATAVSSPEAARGVRASMYDRLHGFDLSTIWLLGPSCIADNTTFRGNQERCQALNVNARRAGLGTDAYDNLYSGINDANVLINGLEEGTLSDEVGRKFRAEALFMRALFQHHAVRIFGYDPNGNGGVVSPNSGPGSGFDLGIVLRTEPTEVPEDATDKARATVPEVYSQINSDLDRALQLFQNLPSSVKENSRFFPSEAAVQALRARVKLYQRDWAAADAAAQEAINLAGATLGSSLAADSSGLASIFDETTGDNPEAIFEIDTNPQTESIGVNLAISTYTSIGFGAQFPTQDLLNLYESGDARLEAFYAPCFDEADQEKFESCTGPNDFGFELHKYNSEQGPSRYADDYPHFRIAEMYLIQAEARLNTDGVAPAISRLNDLRRTRNASELDPANYTRESAYDEVLAERRRELVAEGHRFFDLKRLGRDIQKPGDSDPVPFNDIRVLDDLPPSQISANSELQQNPGYN